MEKYCCENAEAEKAIKDLKYKDKTKKFDENFIRELISKQKGELHVKSKYYKGKNIAEGNWSLVKDEEIETLDKEKIADAKEMVFGKKYTRREKDAEYQYVFIPSYYAVKILIKYYLMDKVAADKIYNLKNAVVMRKSKKFYGGLPFILRYLNKISKGSSGKDIRCDFAEIMEELISRKNGLEINNCKDEFINDIIDCIKKSKCTSFVLEKRVIDFEKNKEKYYIDFKENINYMLNNETQNDYKILAHREVDKDWNCLKKAQREKAHEEIKNTPNYPKNEPPKNEHLSGVLKGWLSQRISKKDRLVYKIDQDEKIVYIATVCDHYKDVFRRSKSVNSYKKMSL